MSAAGSRGNCIEVAGMAYVVSRPRNLSNGRTMGTALHPLSVGFDEHLGCARVKVHAIVADLLPGHIPVTDGHIDHNVRVPSVRSDRHHNRAVSSKRTSSTTVRFNLHAGSHTLLFCSPWFRAVRQRNT